MKIRIDLTEEQHEDLVQFLNEWLERLGNAEEIKVLAKLIEHIDDNYVEVEEELEK